MEPQVRSDLKSSLREAPCCPQRLDWERNSLKELLEDKCFQERCVDAGGGETHSWVGVSSRDVQAMQVKIRHGGEPRPQGEGICRLRHVMLLKDPLTLGLKLLSRARRM